MKKMEDKQPFDHILNMDNAMIRIDYYQLIAPNAIHMQMPNLPCDGLNSLFYFSDTLCECALAFKKSNCSCLVFVSVTVNTGARPTPAL